MRWEFEQQEGDLKIQWRLPDAKGPRGVLVIEGPRSSGLEAWFGPSPEFPAQWLSWRFPLISNCMIQQGGMPGWIDSIGVNERIRSRGLGTRMLQKALKYLQSFGVNQVWLSAAPDSDEELDPLLEFYGRNGFEMAPLPCRGFDENIMMTSLINPVRPRMGSVDWLSIGWTIASMGGYVLAKTIGRQG